MNITATAKFLVQNIVSGKITYKEATKSKPELKKQIDAYIKQQNLKISK